MMWKEADLPMLLNVHRRHNVIDEFKICGRKFCKNAPPLEGYPPLVLKPSPGSKVNETKPWQMKWGRWNPPVGQLEEETEEQVDGEGEVQEEVESPMHQENIEPQEEDAPAMGPSWQPKNSSAVPQDWKDERWFTGPWDGNKSAQQNETPQRSGGMETPSLKEGPKQQKPPRQQEAHVPDYVESNQPVYDVEDCPVEISKIDLVEANGGPDADLKANFALREEVSEGCRMQARDEDDTDPSSPPTDARAAPLPPNEAMPVEAPPPSERLHEEIEEEKLLAKEQNIAADVTEGTAASALAPQKQEGPKAGASSVQQAAPMAKSDGDEKEDWKAKASSYLADPAFLIPACIALVLALVVIILLVVVICSCYKRKLHRDREIIAQQFMTASELAHSRSISTSLDASRLVGAYRQPQPFLKSMSSSSAAVPVPMPQPSQLLRSNQPSKAVLDIPESEGSSRALVSIDGRI